MPDYPDLSVINVQKMLRRHEAMGHTVNIEGGAAKFLGKDYGMALGHELSIYNDAKFRGLTDAPFKSSLHSSIMQAERPVLTRLYTGVLPGTGVKGSPGAWSWGAQPWYPHTELGNGKKSTFEGSTYGLMDDPHLTDSEKDVLLNEHTGKHHFNHLSHIHHPSPESYNDDSYEPFLVKGVTEKLNEIPSHAAHRAIESHKTLKMPYVGTMWDSSQDSPVTYLRTHSDLNKHWDLQEAIKGEAPLGNKLIHVRYNPNFGYSEDYSKEYNWSSYAYDPMTEELHRLG